jgi:hypothetical protein
MKYAWVKGKRKYLGKYGTKISLASDLILMKDIKLSKQDCEYLDIRNDSLYELHRLQSHEYSKLLEYKGWRWKKLK